MTSDEQAVTVVIPARFGSSRFPGKPLALLEGRPLIRHVYERVHRIPEVRRVIVATDDERIQETVERFGGESVLLTDTFRTGTDRVAAVARTLRDPVFLNLQGDEIVLQPDLLRDLIVPFLQSSAEIGTLKRRLTSFDEWENPSIVKVVTTPTGEALYFSRAPIPHHRDVPDPANWKTAECPYMHLGLYIFRRDALLRFADLPTGRLEAQEQLEQLRALEHKIPIHVWETSCSSLRIDTPEDLEYARTVIRQEEGSREVDGTRSREVDKKVTP